jgi:hypothetical protein
MNKTLKLAARFCGPPDSGNGGYVCGVLAGYIDSTAEVTLHRPPPLETPLHIAPLDNGTVALRDGKRLVAEGRPVEFKLEIPAAPNYATARKAALNYSGFKEHLFPNCFVCGPQRHEGDGMRIFAGPVAGIPMVAAPWTPHPSLSDGTGKIRTEFVWAALDCPGYFAVTGTKPRLMLLGRMAARIEATVQSGKRYTVTAWPISSNGRKHVAGTALFSESGRLQGHAVSTWIAVGSADRPPHNGSSD